MVIGEGFPGERLRVLAPDARREAERSPVTEQLLVTDVGWFPRARRHGRRRPGGVEATIVILCVAGQGWCEVDGRQGRIGAGYALVLPSGTPHRYGASEVDPWTIAWMHVVGPLARRFEVDLPGEGARVLELHDPDHVRHGLEETLGRLETDDRPTTLARASGSAYAVLAELTADARSGAPVRDQPVGRALEHVRAHLDRPVVIAELAEIAGVSPSHFSALFRAATGGGAVAYVKRLRIARASELLATTELPIAQVARTVGYDDPLYFSRHFRAITGCSPTRFRQRDVEQRRPPS